MKKGLLLAALLLALSLPSFAAGLRTDKNIGFHLGMFEPYPTLFSANAAYRPIEKVLATLGIGIMFGGKTMGASGRYLFMPDSEMSPFAGLALNRSTFVDVFGGLFGGTPDPDEVVWTTAIIVGIDWQSSSGLNVGFGLNKVLFMSPSDAYSTTFFPWASVGWYF